MPPRVVKAFLVVRSDGALRISKTRRRSLAFNEVAFPLTVTIPAGWGQYQEDSIEVKMPIPPKAEVRAGKAIS